MEQDRRAQSFRPLTISVENLPSSTARQDTLTSYAAARAKLLLGCFRTGEANDPETYVAAITAILARYPEEIVTSVTHPATGLPKKQSWLPTIKEVSDACEAAIEPIRQNEVRLKRIKEQFEMRERERNGVRPSLDQMKEKYGENWGLDTFGGQKKEVARAPSWQSIISQYQANPSRLGRLLNTDTANARGANDCITTTPPEGETLQPGPRSDIERSPA